MTYTIYDKANRATHVLTSATDETGAVKAEVTGLTYDANGNVTKTLRYADRVNWPASIPSDPASLGLPAETEATQKAYGLDNAATKPFGEQCLAARKLVEKGVRFVQIFHGSNGGAGAWDAHGALKNGHTALCKQVDQPIGALIRDLKQRGLLDETLIVLGTEFGRTPGCQGSDGRDHHPYGFSVVLAGGGIKGGIAHGATDELGFHATEHRHYVTDVHATVLHLLGLDAHRLEIPGRKRLEIDFGKPIFDIIA